jgi:hypothetical protein
MSLMDVPTGSSTNARATRSVIMTLHFTQSLGRHRAFDIARTVWPLFGTVCEVLAFAWGSIVVAMFLLVAAGFCA